MATKLPALDKAAPIVETAFGRITPYFQRFWQNVTTEVARAIDAVEVVIPDELSLKAPLNSPSLTGYPTAPTAAPGTATTQIATTEFTAAGLALKAPLDSPALTGTPSAPTATAGTSTTQVATTAFATGAVVDLYNYLSVGAPPALDTFAEVAAELALKAPLNSPALTGAPSAPTASAGDNSTRLATTAYADGAAAAAASAASAGKADKANFAGLASATGVADGSAFDIATVTLPQLAAYVAAMRNAGAA